MADTLVPREESVVITSSFVAASTTNFVGSTDTLTVGAAAEPDGRSAPVELACRKE